jgi:pimeloyl-ACP methyl ester carboxylesterase
MAEFGLIHGGMHGAWCWDLIKSDLEQRGHRVFTVDLPCDDVSSGAEDCARISAATFADAGDNLVLVAHSIGALVGALVPTLRPIRRVIFLCSPLPDVRRSLLDQIASDGVSRTDTLASACLDDMGRAYYTEETANALLFHDCAPELARWAFERLRPQSQLVMTETTPLRAWPELDYHYILTTDDRQLDKQWARKTVPRRLGTVPIELPGGHSPFFSQPRLLARTLHELLS